MTRFQGVTGRCRCRASPGTDSVLQVVNIGQLRRSHPHKNNSDGCPNWLRAPPLALMRAPYALNLRTTLQLPFSVRSLVVSVPLIGVTFSILITFR